MGMQVNDFYSFAADLRSNKGRVGARAAAVVNAVAANVQADAVVLAPVDTGNLRNSASRTVTGDGRFSRIRAEVAFSAHYAVYQEFGTSKMRAQPFLGPALDRWTPAWESGLAQALDGLIR